MPQISEQCHKLDAFSLIELEGEAFLIHTLSGRILSINTSAATMIHLLQSGMSVPELVSRLSAQLAIPADKIELDIEALLSSLTLDSPPQPTPTLCPQAATPPNTERPYRLSCQLNHCLIDIYFNTAEAYHQNALLLSPITTRHEPRQPDHIITCDTHTEGCALWLDEQPYIASPEAEWLHGLLRRCLIQTVYGNAETLLTLHAAAVYKDGQAILFIAASGSGKSTLTHYLCSNGFDYLGDDSIPVDLARNLAYPLPTGISLKAGSWPLISNNAYGALQHQSVSMGNKTFKIWQPVLSKVHTTRAPISAIVFNHFDPLTAESVNRLPLSEAIQALDRSQTRFNPNTSQNTSIACLQWLANTPCYQLTYPNREQALSAIHRIATRHWCKH